MGLQRRWRHSQRSSSARYAIQCRDLSQFIFVDEQGVSPRRGGTHASLFLHQSNLALAPALALDRNDDSRAQLELPFRRDLITGACVGSGLRRYLVLLSRPFPGPCWNQLRLRLVFVLPALHLLLPVDRGVESRAQWTAGPSREIVCLRRVSGACRTLAESHLS